MAQNWIQYALIPRFWTTRLSETKPGSIYLEVMCSSTVHTLKNLKGVNAHPKANPKLQDATDWDVWSKKASGLLDEIRECSQIVDSCTVGIARALEGGFTHRLDKYDCYGLRVHFIGTQNYLGSIPHDPAIFVSSNGLM